MPFEQPNITISGADKGGEAPTTETVGAGAVAEAAPESDVESPAAEASTETITEGEGKGDKTYWINNPERPDAEAAEKVAAEQKELSDIREQLNSEPKVELSATDEEAAPIGGTVFVTPRGVEFGLTNTVTMKEKYRTCERCKGAGRIWLGLRRCPACRGKGVVVDSREHSITKGI